MKLLSKTYEYDRLQLVFGIDVSNNSEFRVEIRESKNITSIPFQTEGNKLIIQIPFRRDRSSAIKVLIFDGDILQFQLRTQLYKYPVLTQVSSEDETSTIEIPDIKPKDKISQESSKRHSSDNDITIDHDIQFDLKDISFHATQMINGELTYAAN